MIIQPSFGGCLHLRIAIPVDKNRHPLVCANVRCIIKNHPPLVCANGAVHRKNRRRAVLYVSTGLVRLPRDTSGTRNYRRRAVVERCCAEGNRRSAVLYVSTGLARLPRDTYRRRAVVEMPSPHRHRRGATALFRNPVRGAKRMRAGILRSFSSRVPEVRHYLWRDG